MEVLHGQDCFSKPICAKEESNAHAHPVTTKSFLQPSPEAAMFVSRPSTENLVALSQIHPTHCTISCLASRSAMTQNCVWNLITMALLHTFGEFNRLTIQWMEHDHQQIFTSVL